MSLSQPPCCKVRESHLLTAGLIQLMAHEYKLLLHGSASLSDRRGRCCHITVETGMWLTALEKSPPGCPSFVFYISSRRNTCSGCSHLQLVPQENKAGAKTHSMRSIISKMNHGLNLILLKEYNKYLFWGNGNVSRRLKCKKIV